MEQRLSLITLGVWDLQRARTFYESLGWQTGARPDDDVVFFPSGGHDRRAVGSGPSRRRLCGG
jgi:uncharacterized protein